MAIQKPSDIPGWFPWDDRALFGALLDAQRADPGVLIELGVYLGRSAVAIGAHRAPGERFVVVDLFGDDIPTHGSGGRADRVRSYRTLAREQFEANYLAVLPELPEVVQGPSSEIVDHVEPGTARFVHIDASHLYGPVAQDIRNAKLLLRPNGVVVFDDYRAPHTPGVAAAVWEAVANHGLVPFALTHQKLYATWGDATEFREIIWKVIDDHKGLTGGEQEVLGHTIIRIRRAGRTKRQASPPPPPSPPPRRPLIRRARRRARRLLARAAARVKNR